MTDRTHPDSGFPIAYSHYATYAEYVEALHARIAELEAQLESIGAGGVSGPLVGRTDNKERAGRFTKKPVTIDAWLIDFGNKPLPDWVNEAFRTEAIDWCPAGEGLYINTLEGHMLGANGSWLIKGVKGELYACKPDIFAATYERASLAASEPPEGITRDDTVHGETYFTAADMATAEARGFRDGVASVAASAGSEPVAWPKDAAEVREFFCSDFIRAEYVADDRQPCDEDRYYISAHDFLSAINWWADFPHHPSPPKGMVGGWMPLPPRPTSSADSRKGD